MRLILNILGIALIAATVSIGSFVIQTRLAALEHRTTMIEGQIGLRAQ